MFDDDELLLSEGLLLTDLLQDLDFRYQNPGSFLDFNHAPLSRTFCRASFDMDMVAGFLSKAEDARTSRKSGQLRCALKLSRFGSCEGP